MMKKSPYVYQDGNRWLLGNDRIEGRFDSDGFPHLAMIENKATGRLFRFRDVQECVLRMATSEFRQDIAMWKFCPGSGEAVPAEQESGFLAGFHQPFCSEENWLSAGLLSDMPIGLPGYSPVVYPGYGWYRTAFEIPAKFQGKPVEFGLGGCDHQDWLEYRVFLNGELIGQANPEGFWHAVPKYTLKAGDPAYGWLKFGEPNLLAIQTRGLDRRTPGMSVPDAERYSVGSFLVDQYVSVGAAFREISDFEQRSCRTFEDETHAGIEVMLADPSGTLEIKLTHRVDAGEAVLYKQIEVANVGPDEQVLLELDLQKLTVDADLGIGGQGAPCFVGGELFAGIQHPSGIARGNGRTLCLQSWPGRRLSSGSKYVSKQALIGAGPAGQAGPSFTQYLERQGARARTLERMFHCYGIHDLAGLAEPTELTEEMVLKSVDILTEYQKKEIHFDWYWIDAGWANPKGDLKDFNPRNFPDGPGRMARRIQELGMKLGLWTSPAQGPMAFHVNPENPHLVRPEDFCLAEGKWAGMYQDALLHHIRENGVRGFKLDAVSFSCNCPDHRHLPMKYSMEPLMDALIGILENVRRVCPDIFYMFYWNIRSPWWLLHGQTIYERGILMEGSTASDFPTHLLRQSVTISFDQATRHAWDHVPLAAGDSLGIWISKWRWSNYMRAEGWRDAWVMDVARGSLLHQLWGDLGMFNDEDVTFLSRFSRLVQDYSSLLHAIPSLLGDPWKAQPYGYLYEDPNEALVFLFNPRFQSDRIIIPQLGSAEVLLCPFEVRVIHTNRASGRQTVLYPFAPLDRKGQSLTAAWLEESRSPVDWSDPSSADILRKSVQGRACYVESSDADKRIAFISEARDRDVWRLKQSGAISLPADAREGQTLVVTVRLSRDGIYWHHHALHEVMHLGGCCGNEKLSFRSTPHRWHEEAGGWSWILFEAPLPATPHAETVSLTLETCLPRSVDMEIQSWMLQGAG